MTMSFRGSHWFKKCEDGVSTRPGEIYRGKNTLRVSLVMLFLWGTCIVSETSGEVHHALKHNNRYHETMMHRQFHQVPHPPTPAGILGGDVTVSSPSSFYRHHTVPPTRVFYKAPATTDLRRNGSRADVPLMRWKPPPNHNPWFSLYHPSVAPLYNHRTKKPVEPSWKPAHVVMDEDPRVNHPSRIHETHSNQKHAPKDYYKHLYGTHEGVKHLKGHYGPSNLSDAKTHIGVTQELEDVKLANEHFLRMRSGGRCKVPAPEVVCVKDIYPNPTKEYLPRCTLLHRCGDRSGCCDSEAMRCVPRAIQEVALNFYILHVGLPASHADVGNSVEKLFFSNHTDCECVPSPTSTAVPPHQPAQDEAKIIENEDPPLPDNQKELRLNEIQHEEENDSEEIQTKPKCRECPLPFYPRHHPDGRCGCDCFDKQKPCIRIKRGRDALPDIERRCVESNKCNIPECEYGDYMTSVGRCPKKPEDFQKPVKNNHGYQPPRSLHNPKDRWTYYERD